MNFARRCPDRRLFKGLPFGYAGGQLKRGGAGLRRRHFLALASILPLAACNSQLNPFNWFGGGQRSEEIAPPEVIVDPRPLVPQVTRLVVDPHPSGAIVRVTGLPPRQGWYDGALVRVPGTEAGVIAFQLRAYAPHYQTLVSTPQSREIVVATFVNTDQLVGVREIRVSGQLNALSSRR